MVYLYIAECVWWYLVKVFIMFTSIQNIYYFVISFSENDVYVLIKQAGCYSYHFQYKRCVESVQGWYWFIHFTTCMMIIIVWKAYIQFWVYSYFSWNMRLFRLSNSVLIFFLILSQFYDLCFLNNLSFIRVVMFVIITKVMCHFLLLIV